MGYVGDDKVYVESSIEAAGITVIQPSDEEPKLLAEYRKTEADLVIEMSKEAGLEGAEEVVHAFLRNLEKWEGIIAEIGYDVEKYEEALNREIYSKLDK